MIDKTVQAVFDKAIYLIDAQNESTGSTNNSDTTEYRVRTIGILNNLLDEVFIASETFFIDEDGHRGALDDITSFDDALDLDARILRNVLPCGLAAKLLSEENPQLANYFQQLYERGLEEAKRQIPATIEEIDGSIGGPYGGIEHGEYGRWNF